MHVAAWETFNGKLYCFITHVYVQPLDIETSLAKISEHSGDEKTIVIKANVTCHISWKVKILCKEGAEIWLNNLKTCRLAIWYLCHSIKVKENFEQQYMISGNLLKNSLL